MRRLSGILTTTAIVIVLFALAACTDNGDPGDELTTTPPVATTGAAPATPGATPTGAGTTVTATLTDFKIALSQSTFSAGPYTFVVEQKGQSPHILAIKGPGVDSATPTIQAGGAAQRLNVTLQPGVYMLTCPVGNHVERGMTMMITVT